MAVSIFFCYAHEDEALLNKLKAHLRPLVRQGLIAIWYDRDISAGTKWEEEINKHLDEAEIILLLISPDFMDSDYCYGKEMQRALERDQRGEARVIPIILRSVHWQGILGTFQALPTDAKPVRSWLDVDEALYDVAEGILKVVVQLSTPLFSSSEVNFSQVLKYPDLVLLSYYKLEGDYIAPCRGAAAWSPNGKYIGVIGFKAVHIFEAYSGKKVFACDHKFGSIFYFSLLWGEDSDLNPKMIIYHKEIYHGNLIDKLTGKTILTLWGASTLLDNGKFLPDHSKPEYWRGKVVESLIALTLENSPDLPNTDIYYLYLCGYCLWSPNLEYIAIPKGQNMMQRQSMEVYKVLFS